MRENIRSGKTRRNILKKSIGAGLGSSLAVGTIVSGSAATDDVSTSDNGNEPRGKYFQESEVHYDTSVQCAYDVGPAMMHCSLSFIYWDSFENGTGEALHQFSNTAHGAFRNWDYSNSEWEPLIGIDYLKNKLWNLKDSSTSLLAPQSDDERMLGVHTEPEYQGGTQYDYTAAIETGVNYLVGSLHPAIGAYLAADEIYNELANTGQGGSGQSVTYDWAFGNMFGGQKEDATGSAEFYIESGINTGFDVQVEGNFEVYPNMDCPTTYDTPDDNTWTALRLKVDDPNVDDQASTSSMTESEIAAAKGPGEKIPFDQIDNPVLKDFANGGPLVKRKYPVRLAEPVE